MTIATLILICNLALFLLGWFRTDGVLEYARLLRMDWFFHFKDYDAKVKEDLTLTYIQYLRRNHNNFFVRLISCPICFAVWGGTISAFFSSSMLLTPIIIVGGLLLFTIIDRLLG